MLRASGVDEAGGLTAVDYLGKFTMQEGVLDVELAGQIGERDGEDGMHGGRFDNRTERLVEVNTWLLRKAPKYPTSFIATEGAIGLELVT